MPDAKPAHPSAPFWWHRIALTPNHATTSAATLDAALALALANGENAFLAFLLNHGLGPVWHEALQCHGLYPQLSVQALNILEASRFAAAASYLPQAAALRQIDRLFAGKGIAYAAIKGSAVRELVYNDPALRPAADLDLLVSPEHRLAAAEALVAAGFQYHPQAATASHEASFSRGEAHIDLHWNIFRPGRTRCDMVAPLLAKRQRIGVCWGLSDVDTLFLMLTHPVIVNYACSPNLALCRVVDFIRWVERRAVDWDAVAERLEQAGLKTAAWVLLRWFSLLGVAVDEPFIAKLRPGQLRARYLEYWLEHDLPTRWLTRRPWLIQLGLTLPIHDCPSDAARALRGWLQARREQHRDPFAFLSSTPR